MYNFSAYFSHDDLSKYLIIAIYYKTLDFQSYNALVLINIHIVDSIKEELLIGSNWFSKYKADLILTENKLEFEAQERKFGIKIINTISSNAKVQWYKEDENIKVISVTSDSDNESTLILPEKTIDWLYRAVYFVKYNKSTNEAVEEWLKIENERLIIRKFK